MVGRLAKIVARYVGSVSTMNSVIKLTEDVLMDVFQATVEPIVQKVLIKH